MRSGWRLNSAYLLLMCGFLFVFTETILSPFYPQFFAQVFGVEDLVLTGQYVALCRLTVLLSAPIWGFIARHYDPLKLLIIGQSVATVVTLLLSQASSLSVFLGLSVLLLLFKSSYFLFYSLLIELQGKKKQASTVGQVQLVVHAALIASALASAWVLELTNPLQMFVVVALLDLLQVGLCVLVFRHRRQNTKLLHAKTASIQSPIHSISTNDADVAVSPATPSAWAARTIMAYGLLVLGFSIATNSVRPYLTAYSSEVLGVDRLSSAYLYLIPSVMAFAVFPILHTAWVKRIQVQQAYALMLLLLTLSLAWQAFAQGFYELVAARMLFGFSMLLGQALLEMYLFAHAADSPHWYFSLSSTVQHAGQLLAPLLAAWVVLGWGLAAPFWLAALILAGSGLAIYWGLSAHTASLPLQRSI